MCVCVCLCVCPRFAINLQCGQDAESDDIAFHFNPRFSEGEVVRNSREGGEWGEEERDQPYFPFQPEDRFELAFVVLPYGIRVSADPFCVCVCVCVYVYV